MPSLPKGPMAIRGHGLDPTVVMRWRRYHKAILRDVSNLRIKLAEAKVDGQVYTEHLLNTFAATALEEALLATQFQWVLQRAETLQAIKASPDKWSPLLSLALKINATLKGPRFMKMVTLREVVRLCAPGTIPEADIDLREYLSKQAHAQSAEQSRLTRGVENRTAKDAENSTDAMLKTA